MYDRCHLADGCGGDEACAALCPDIRRPPRDEQLGEWDAMVGDELARRAATDNRALLALYDRTLDAHLRAGHTARDAELAALRAVYDAGRRGCPA